MELEFVSHIKGKKFLHIRTCENFIYDCQDMFLMDIETGGVVLAYNTKTYSKDNQKVVDWKVAEFYGDVRGVNLGELNIIDKSFHNEKTNERIKGSRR